MTELVSRISVMKESDRTFTLDELAGLVELPRRTVRYYIQIGLVDRPEGAGRGARYTEQHLDQLLDIRKWQKAGLSLDRIRELIGSDTGAATMPPLPPRQKGAVEVWSHIVVNDGVELTVDPRRANLTPEEVRELATGLMGIYENICSKKE